MEQEQEQKQQHKATRDALVMSVEDVVKFCGISRAYVYRALKTGELAGRNIGGTRGWLTTKTAVLDWLETGNMESEEG